MNESLPADQPKFTGNPEDLEHFMRLNASHIRSPEREEALQTWSEYKKEKQIRYVREVLKNGRTPRHSHRTRTAPAIDLRGAILRDVCLGRADFRGVQFDHSELSIVQGFPWAAMKGGKFQGASLKHVIWRGTRLMEADFREANLSDADLTGADLSQANLAGANLSNAILQDANLEHANLVGANLVGTDLRGSRVYGVSAWDIQIDDNDALRRDLIVTPSGQPDVTVDNIEVAQFIYLILNNGKLRDVINTITAKSVLILGRFALPERKGILDALKNKLREYNLLPIVFDFDRPTDKDLTETIKTLAGLSYFVIADITSPRSAPLELQATIPEFQIPFVPIIQEGEEPFAMMVDLQKKYNWVLKTRTYSSKEVLINKLKEGIIEPAMQKHNELRLIKAQEPDTVSLG